jgi:hypothetical protein
MTAAVAIEETPALLPDTAAIWRRALLAWVIMAMAMSLNGMTGSTAATTKA